MFVPALEYRKFVQRNRTDQEREKKLADLAFKVKVSKKDNRPATAIMREIMDSYLHGYDILDPEFFEKEDIEAFAKENGIQKDPQVIDFINRAIPRIN